MRKSEGALSRFQENMGLKTRAEKVWFWITFALLVVYVEAVLFLQDYDTERVGLLRTGLGAVCAVPVCFAGVYLCRKARFASVERDLPGKKRLAVLFIVVALAVFTYMFLWQCCYWPGSFSRDSYTQLDQVTSGHYNNWHPVLHTWLFFTLPYSIFHTMASIVTFQLVWFSLAVSYLFVTLYRQGCNKVFLALGCVYILANPTTIQIMLHPWKDSAMSIFSLVLFTQLIRIYATDGQWLKKWYDLAAFILFAFLTNAVRHNAILLVAPVLVVLLVFLKNARRQALISIAGVLAATLVLQGPVYSLAKVEAPDQRVVETMGLPMTILCNVYRSDPDALSPEVREFMDSLATPFDWEFYHQTGDFNPIKWYSSKNLPVIVDAAGYETLFRYTGEALRSSPRYAWQALVRLTSLVWSVSDGPGWTIGVAGGPENSLLAQLTNGYFDLTTLLPLGYLFNFVGFTLLIMLFAAVSCVGSGLDRAFLVLAPLAYSFGTMLLLSGQDFRFFHCDFMLIVPLLYLFLCRERTTKNEA